MFSKGHLWKSLFVLYEALRQRRARPSTKPERLLSLTVTGGGPSSRRRTHLCAPALQPQTRLQDGHQGRVPSHKEQVHGVPQQPQCGLTRAGTLRASWKRLGTKPNLPM